MESNVSQAEAELFKKYGVFQQFIFGDEVKVNGQTSSLHVVRRSMLIRDHKWIEELVKDYARQRGWKSERFLGKEESSDLSEELNNPKS